MRIYDATKYDVKVTLEAESIESTIVSDILETFKNNGYTQGTKTESQNAISFEFNKSK